MVAVAAALARAGSAAEPAPEMPAVEPFVKQATAEGWQVVTIDPDTPPRYLYLGKPGEVSTLGPYVMAWFRQERSEPKTYDTVEGKAFPSRSSLQSWVFDCSGARSDVSGVVAYADNGASGESLVEHRKIDALNLSGDEPTSAAAQLRAWACKRATVPKKAPAPAERAPARP